MINKELVERLHYFNEWRRGGEGEQPHPTQLGIDINRAIELIAIYEHAILHLIEINSNKDNKTLKILKGLVKHDK